MALRKRMRVAGKAAVIVIAVMMMSSVGPRNPGELLQ